MAPHRLAVRHSNKSLLSPSFLLLHSQTEDMPSAFSVKAALLFLVGLVSAQGCIDDPNYGCNGLYTIDGNGNGDCGVDPDDGSDFALPVTICPCNNGEILTAQVVSRSTVQNLHCDNR